MCWASVWMTEEEACKKAVYKLRHIVQILPPNSYTVFFNLLIYHFIMQEIFL